MQEQKRDFDVLLWKTIKVDFFSWIEIPTLRESCCCLCNCCDHIVALEYTRAYVSHNSRAILSSTGIRL